MRTRILLVDPSVDDRESLRSLLECNHCEIATASTREEALTKVHWAHLAIIELHLGDGGKLDFGGEKLALDLREQRIPCMFYAKRLDQPTIRRLLASQGRTPLALEAVPKDKGPQGVLDAAQEIIHNLRLDCPVIVHVSDLHFEPSGIELLYDQERSRKELINDLTALNLHRRVICLVVTGDISKKCLDGSFDEAAKFLLGLAKELGIPKEHIILTPGNHDVNRYKALEAKSNMDYQLTKGIKAPIEATTLFRKFDDFLKFTEIFYGEPAFRPDKLWRTFAFPDSNLVIVALNSCVREGHPEYRCKECDKEHYHGWLGTNQVKDASRELDLNYGNKLMRVAVFHHHALPREAQHGVNDCQDCLWDYGYDSNEAKKRLADGDFKLLLHGHQHKARLSFDLTEPIHNIFGSGTLLIRDTNEAVESPWDNKYLIFDLSCRPGESHVLMRKYEPSKGRGKWITDGEQERIPLSSDVVLSYV